MSLTSLLLSASTSAGEAAVNLTDATNIVTITSFTFFVGCMAMMAASVFFFFEMWNVDKYGVLLYGCGLITFIAFVPTTT